LINIDRNLLLETISSPMLMMQFNKLVHENYSSFRIIVDLILR